MLWRQQQWRCCGGNTSCGSSGGSSGSSSERRNAGGVRPAGGPVRTNGSARTSSEYLIHQGATRRMSPACMSVKPPTCGRGAGGRSSPTTGVTHHHLNHALKTRFGSRTPRRAIGLPTWSPLRPTGPATSSMRGSTSGTCRKASSLSTPVGVGAVMGDDLRSSHQGSRGGGGSTRDAGGAACTCAACREQAQS